MPAAEATLFDFSCLYIHRSAKRPNMCYIFLIAWGSRMYCLVSRLVKNREFMIRVMTQPAIRTQRMYALE